MIIGLRNMELKCSKCGSEKVSIQLNDMHYLVSVRCIECGNSDVRKPRKKKLLLKQTP